MQALENLILVFVAAVLFLGAGCETLGQKTTEKRDRAATRTEQRVDREADRAIDHSVDRVLGKVFD